MANRAMADMVRYATEFGMTPSSRSRIAGNTDPNQGDFDEFWK
jgi:phage terminase small subunit